ncbi:MAG: hypothetical protein KDE58_42440, partial [Caldilineaceae bacterium]|nr:hypothetical protein [Caldilineaceae bacterium]
FATVVAIPGIQTNCGGAALISTGYNVISDGSCTLQQSDQSKPDQINRPPLLQPLALNNGATRNYLPTATDDNVLLDLVPLTACEQALGASPRDQRNQPRPRTGKPSNLANTGSTSRNFCDAGAVELGFETRYVCGPPVGKDDAGYCQNPAFASIRQALEEALDEDTIVIMGVITENVTVAKSVTIRGPSVDEATPGAHMAFVQGAPTQPDQNSAPTGSVFTIAAGATVTLEQINIRHGYADQGGGIHNAGSLTVNGVTIYHSRATTGGAL